MASPFDDLIRSPNVYPIKSSVMTYPILTVTLPLCSVLQQHDTIMPSSSEPHKMLSLRKIGNKFRRLIIPI